MVLFFLFAFLLFFPLKFVFSAILDIKLKRLSLKLALFNFIPVFRQKLFLNGFSIVDKNGKKKRLLKNKKINVKKAFYIKKVQVLYICNMHNDLFYFDTIFNIFAWFYNVFDENYRFYIKNHSKLKIIATDGIIYTSIAKIIITVIFSYGVWLWKTVKIKLKKLLTD